MPNGIFHVFNAVRHDISVKNVQSTMCFELRRSDTFKTYLIPHHRSLDNQPIILIIFIILIPLIDNSPYHFCYNNILHTSKMTFGALLKTDFGTRATT